MTASYVTGDVIINNLYVYSTRGTLNLSNAFVAASIYESIFTPGIVCDIIVADTNDQLGQLKISGDEVVAFSTAVMGGISANYFFALYELGDLESMGAQKSKMYTLKCVSQESMFAKTNYVQKSYNMLCSEMIQDVHKNYLQSDKQIIVEDSKGSQNIVIPNKNPFEAISLIKKRAVSSDNLSSSYVYYETRENEKQAYKFVTIESMFNGPVLKEFQQSDAINSNIRVGRIDNNILAYRVPRQLSSIDKIDLAGPRKITAINLTTQQFKSDVIQTNNTDFATGGTKNSDTSSAFTNLYGSKNPRQAFIPVDWSERAATNIPESSANFQAYLALLMQNTMRIRVPGDTILVPGGLIFCNIPNKQAFTTNVKNDSLISGNFVISRIHHRIGMVMERPRYTCIIECIKGKPNEGVQ